MHTPPSVIFGPTKLVGLPLRDVVLTPTGPGDQIAENSRVLGQRYVSELGCTNRRSGGLRTIGR